MTNGLPTYDVSTLAKGLRTEIKGTYFYPETLKAMMYANGGRQNSEFTAEVTIVPEPDNPHSKSGNALSVRWSDQVIGHIPSELSENFQQLRRIAASDFDPSTLATVWVAKDYKGEWRFNVSVLLGDPELLVPLNDPPIDGYTVIPAGNAIQVTKESDHLDILAEYVPPSGVGHLLVTLHIIEAGIRTKWDGIEVRLDGSRIGELSKASSEKFAPAVRHFDDLGLLTVTHATIKGSSLAAEVALYASRANELTEDQLSPTNYNPLPRLVEFQENPRDYVVPNRWQGENNQRENKRTSPHKAAFATTTVTTATPTTTNFAPIDWEDVLRPDGTPRANLFQRGYVRASIGEHFPQKRGPRIDYATVGQCEKILAHYGEPTEEIKKRGSILLKMLWWVLLFLLFIVALVGVFTPPVGFVFTALVIWPFAYHYITRSKLRPPFSKQQ